MREYVGFRTGATGLRDAVIYTMANIRWHLESIAGCLPLAGEII